MDVAFTGLLWIVGLGTALYASEKLVHYLTSLRGRVRISPGFLGLLVAFGADAPEVTSALIATLRGSTDIGLGVVLGSNIYNLVGLLGLAAIITRRLPTDLYHLALDGGTNVLLTLGLICLVLLPGFHLPLGAALLLLLLAYGIVASLPRERLLHLLPESMSLETEEPGSPLDETQHTAGIVLLVVVSIVFIVIGSSVLVNASIALGPRLGVPPAVTGTFVLAIATSLPNTWAAISLARRRLGAAAIATTFNSNSINAALGAGLPSLVLTLHASHAARTIDVGWLLGMTAVAIVLLATRRAFTRLEGALLAGMYLAFVVARLIWFR